MVESVADSSLLGAHGRLRGAPAHKAGGNRRAVEKIARGAQEARQGGSDFDWINIDKSKRHGETPTTRIRKPTSEQIENIKKPLSIPLAHRVANLRKIMRLASVLPRRAREDACKFSSPEDSMSPRRKSDS
jgi:hypothetical protein